jgi:hypothetical protein
VAAVVVEARRRSVAPWTVSSDRRELARLAMPVRAVVDPRAVSEAVVAVAFCVDRRARANRPARVASTTVNFKLIYSSFNTAHHHRFVNKSRNLFQIFFFIIITTISAIFNYCVFVCLSISEIFYHINCSITSLSF